jgi:hypothetical protein
LGWSYQATIQTHFRSFIKHRFFLRETGAFKQP